MKNSEIKLISFDLDNTLYDNWPVIKKAEEKSQGYLKQAFEKQNKVYNHQTFLSHRERLLALKIKLPEEQKRQFENLSWLRERVLKKCCESLENHDKIALQSFQIFIDYRNRVSIREEIRAMLNQLSGKFALATITNGNCDAGQLSISHLLERNYSPTQGFRAKPHPEMIFRLFEDFSLEPNQVLHVGDQYESDGIAAEEAGCQFHHFEPFIKGKDCSVVCNKLLRELEI